MQRSGEAGFLVQVHAENDAIVEGMSQQLVDEGKRSLKYHALARPAVAEAEAVGRGLLFSRATGSPVYFVHLSTPLAVDLGKFEGKPATIIVLPAPGEPSFVNVYAVAPGCPTGTFLAWAHVALP
jgi:dihydroorotase-like cyclic amidohydrolase